MTPHTLAGVLLGGVAEMGEVVGLDPRGEGVVVTLAVGRDVYRVQVDRLARRREDA